MLVALAIAWRPDFGLAALVAVAAALAVAGEGRRALYAALVAVAGALVVYVPFLVAAGPHQLWEHLFGITLREGSAWRLPFPVLYDGRLRLTSAHTLLQDGKDLIGYELPLVALVLLVASAATLAWRRGPRPARLIPAGVTVLGAFGAMYLRSRADEFHVQPLAVCAAILAALAIARTGGALRVALALGLGFVALAGVANRVSALVLPPDLRAVHLHGVPGIGVPPGEAAALPRVVGDGRPARAAGAARLRRAAALGPRRLHRPAAATCSSTARPWCATTPRCRRARPSRRSSSRVLRRTRPVVIRWTRPAVLQARAQRARALERLARARPLPGRRLRTAGALRQLRDPRPALGCRAVALGVRIALALVALVIAGWLAVEAIGAHAETQLRAIAFAGSAPDPATRARADTLLARAERLNPDQRPELYRAVAAEPRGRPARRAAHARRGDARRAREPRGVGAARRGGPRLRRRARRPRGGPLARARAARRALTARPQGAETDRREHDDAAAPRRRGSA